MPERTFSIKIDGGIELKLLSEHDAAAMFHLINTNRIYLRQWLPWIDYTQSIEDERSFIHSTIVQYQENRSISCAIWYQGRIVGSLGYHPFDWVNRKVEIGYWLAEQFQGRGIMTKSCNALLAYAFNELKLNKVEIRCATGNTQSCAIPERLNFKLEGIIRNAEWLYDHYVDLRLYGLLMEEWRSE